MKAIIPINIIAGFRTCGVYPFNPAAISIVQEQDESGGDGEPLGETETDEKRGGDDSGDQDNSGVNAHQIFN